MQQGKAKEKMTKFRRNLERERERERELKINFNANYVCGVE